MPSLVIVVVTAVAASTATAAVNPSSTAAVYPSSAAAVIVVGASVVVISALVVPSPLKRETKFAFAVLATVVNNHLYNLFVQSLSQGL